jgi:hypothetical protein
MSLTPNDIRRGRTREPNFNPLENEDWRDPEGQMLAWRLNPQDGWSVPPSLPPFVCWPLLPPPPPPPPPPSRRPDDRLAHRQPPLFALSGADIFWPDGGLRCYPIHPEDSDWLFNMASGVWFNASAEKYCQEVEGRGFVYGQTMIAGNGQMYFVPDEDGSPVRKKATNPDLAVETDADQSVLQCASPVASPSRHAIQAC